ncbi:MAG: hypothetical protein ACK5NI_00400 [bacterium]
MEKNDAYFEDLLKISLHKLVSLDIPQKIHWRTFLDLDDYAKRESHFQDSRLLY